MSETEPTTSQLIAAGAFVFSDIATRNPAMAECLRRARAAARTPVTVLITGQTGTGKTGLAHAIHNASDRKDAPCLVINCSALSDTLLESELFGHEKGAFTGADRLKRGKFELCDGGTLILDEVADLSGAAQAKLLRAVEYRRFERVGGEETLQSDVRLIALTNRDMPQMIRDGVFREDLFFRLREVSIEVPPLCDRPEDIAWLIELFIAESARTYRKPVEGLSDEARAILMAYRWPGNVRELKGVIKQAVVLATGERIERCDLSPELSLPAGRTPAPAEVPAVAAPAAGEAIAPLPGDDLRLETVEKAHILRVLSLCGGNRSRAAERLGIHYTTLLRKLDGYGPVA